MIISDINKKLDSNIENYNENNIEKKNYSKMQVKELRKILEENKIYLPVRAKKEEIIKELNKI